MGIQNFRRLFFDSLKYRLISHNPLLPFPKKRPHQELVVALPFFSKNLTQIRYQFITNILLTALLMIHHKFTTIHLLQGFINKA